MFYERGARARRGVMVIRVDGLIRTTTWVGRVGSPSERKSRTAAVCAQNPQRSGSRGVSGRSSGPTGASHAGQASVPVATGSSRAAGRISSVPDSRPACSPGGTWSLGRCRLTPPRIRPVASAPA